MVHPISKTLEQGVHANHTCSFRQGNIIELPATGDLVITGDLHGHARNLERIMTFSDLGHHPDRHVILHEIIHGGPQTASGGCLSYRVLAQAIDWQLAYPQQVHLIIGNHDTAYLSDAEVMKEGREMNKALDQALREEYPQDWESVKKQIQAFLLSQPLGVHTANRLWFSHSLPADRLYEQFDPAVLNRPLTASDCIKPGSAYILTWGRRMSQDLLNRLKDIFKADLFITGHQPQPEGWAQAGDNLLILASDHNHGTLLRLDRTRHYDIQQAQQAIVPLSSIA